MYSTFIAKSMIGYMNLNISSTGRRCDLSASLLPIEIFSFSTSCLLAFRCFSSRSHSVVVITSALHAEGPRFEPWWEHFCGCRLFLVYVLAKIVINILLCHDNLHNDYITMNNIVWQRNSTIKK